MAYLGLQPQQKTLGTSTEQLTGNGVDFEYTLNRSVSKAADILVFVGNVAQVPEVDYTAAGRTLLFTSQPANAAPISINYRAGALTTLFIDANSYPVGSTTNPSIRSTDAPSTGVYFPSTTSVGVTVSGNTRLTVIDSPTATSTSTGAVRITGGVGITGAVYTGGVVRITDTTDSVSSSSGALVVSGGLGVGQSAYIAGGLQVAGDFTVAGQFTTTGSDSLVLNDPFVFLANANPGDNLDTGFVSSYYDGFDTRYSGLFRDITDGDYKLFFNLLTQPTTTVDTGNVSFRLANLRVGNITATNIFGNIQSGAGITSVGNLANLRVSSTIESWGINYIYSTQATTSSATGALQVSGGVGVAGAIALNSTGFNTAIINSGPGGIGNIGSSGQGFNIAFLRATSAQYADVAERYLADAEYAPGTVLHFGGAQEVSQCNVDHCTRVAGVVSTNPAYIMNDSLQGEHVVDVALLGRVPCQVQGPVSRGDMMVSAGNGRARAESNPKLGAVIGKALQDFDGAEGTIEVVVGRV